MKKTSTRETIKIGESQMPIFDNETAFNTLPPKPDFVLPGIKPGQVGTIISPGGVGKSALALQLCASVVGGPDPLEIAKHVPDSKAVFIALEDSYEDIHHRFKTLQHIATPEQAECLKDREKFTIYPWAEESVDVMCEGPRNALKHVAKGARLLIIDTLVLAHTMDENDNNKMSQVINVFKSIATENNCAIIYLHHVTKGGKGDGQELARGAGAIVNNARWQAYIRLMSDDEAKEHNVKKDAQGEYPFLKFGVAKQNSGKKMKPVWMTRKSNDNPDILGYTLHKAEIEKPKTITKKEKENDGFDL